MRKGCPDEAFLMRIYSEKEEMKMWEIIGNIIGKTDGYKTYAGGVGLIALGVYLCSQGDWAEGAKNISLGIAAIGGRRAIGKKE